MKSRTEVVIIGGGSTGLSAAYHLAQAGIKDVVVLEKEYLGAGATGRCGGGIRQQFSTPANIKLAQKSIWEFKHFAELTGQDIELIPGGYLLLAHTPEDVENFKQNIVLQRSCEVDVRLVTPSEIKKITPNLDVKGTDVLAGAYCQDDCHVNPFLVVQGYANKARQLGVEINIRTEVTGFKVEGSRINRVITNRGEIETKWVILAAGYYSAPLAKTIRVGTTPSEIDLPLTPYRHQILVTEPIGRIQEPLIMSFYHDIYFVQNKHGRFLAGQGHKTETSTTDVRSGWQFLVEIACKLTRLVPLLNEVCCLRQWAGLYDITPDAQPIIGKVSNEAENLIVAAGYSGHGFMLAPAVGTIIAELIKEGKSVSLPIEEMSIDRFRQATTREVNVV